MKCFFKRLYTFCGGVKGGGGGGGEMCKYPFLQNVNLLLENNDRQLLMNVSNMFGVFMTTFGRFDHSIDIGFNSMH